MSGCAGCTGCLFLNRLLTGNKVGKVSLISCKSSGSLSGMVEVGCSTLCNGGHLRPLFFGAVVLKSAGVCAVDLLLARIAGGSLRRIGLCLGLLAVIPPLNRVGIVICSSLACDLVNGNEYLVHIPCCVF